ncbi:RING-type domain-containing protein [Aphelenchoides besseyi]|nr:RING-type domain-containing protein [Aphelenchoides besseyi]
MNNGASTSDTITGGKTLELTEYDRHRKPHTVINDGTLVPIGARTLSSEICCPICLDLFTTTMGTKICLHRFCSECINTALLRNNKECPTCRKKIVSKRSLRCDTNLDGLLSKIWPERRMYDEMQNEAMKHYHQQNCVASLQKSIEAGIKAQAQNRRQRVQGSYDYEKRKRKRKVPEGEQVDVTAPNSPSDATPPINGEDGESMADTNSVTQNDADDSSSSGSYTSDSQSDISSTISDSTDLDSFTSDDDNSPSSNDPTNVNNVNTAPPSLENMLTTSSPQNVSMYLSDAYSDGMELEAELVPTKTLRNRDDFPSSMKKNRYIRADRNITMKHISAFLSYIGRLGLPDSEATIRGHEETPTYFYAFDSEFKISLVPPTETLKHLHDNTANRIEHLKIYYDVDLRNEVLLAEEILDMPPNLSVELDEVAMVD